MNPRRAVLLITSLVVAGLLAWFAVAKWDSASKVAAIISTLAAVAMVGLAVWTGLPAAAKVLNISASKTGKATARGSSHAISGVRAPQATGSCGPRRPATPTLPAAATRCQASTSANAGR
jgi:hypothetical protein